MTTNDVIEAQATETETHLDTVVVKNAPVPAITPEMFDALDKMPEGFSLEQAYLVFDKPGTTRRVFFIGMTEMWSPEQSKNIPAAMFMWRNPETGAIQRAINAGDNLVRQLQSCPVMENGTPVQITYRGKEKANTGRNFNKFDVIVLNPNAAMQMRKDAPAGAEQAVIDTALKMGGSVKHDSTPKKVTPEEVIGYINALQPTDDKNAVKAQVKAYAAALDINLGSPANLGEAIKTLKGAVETMVQSDIPF